MSHLKMSWSYGLHGFFPLRLLDRKPILQNFYRNSIFAPKSGQVHVHTRAFICRDSARHLIPSPRSRSSVASIYFKFYFMQLKFLREQTYTINILNMPFVSTGMLLCTLTDILSRQFTSLLVQRQGQQRKTMPASHSHRPGIRIANCHFVPKGILSFAPQTKESVIPPPTDVFVPLEVSASPWNVTLITLHPPQQCTIVVSTCSIQCE